MGTACRRFVGEVAMAEDMKDMSACMLSPLGVLWDASKRCRGGLAAGVPKIPPVPQELTAGVAKGVRSEASLGKEIEDGLAR